MKYQSDKRNSPDHSTHRIGYNGGGMNVRTAPHYRFGVFELDAERLELRRSGVRVRLNSQSFQLLLLLLEHPGKILTRDEIAQALWPEGTFVDFEHGVNSAINRIREALGDNASNPRFVETISRRGYRFIAPVEPIVPTTTSQQKQKTLSTAPEQPAPDNSPFPLLATPEELPATPGNVVRALYLLLQGMYLGFYVGALANLSEIEELLAVLPHPTMTFQVLTISAAILIPVRVFLICAVLFRPPRVQQKLLQIWPFLLPCDVLWALSPFLLLHHINYGLALACAALLVYSPFAQRALVLMGVAQQTQS